MAYVRKYLPSDVITDFHEAARAIFAGEYLMVCDRATHPSWLGSWHVMELRRAVQRGVIRRALVNPDWKPKAEDTDE